MEKQYSSLRQIPNRISDIEVQELLRTDQVNWSYMARLKDVTALQDEIISNWLNISVKTFRHYKKPVTKFKDNIKEKVILLLSLFEHGIDIFGSREEFYTWLKTENFYFDKKAPVSFLTTVTGTRYVDSRLTAMEYGDNI
jgi:uncharacterized protein (DUF2384 family)